VEAIGLGEDGFELPAEAVIQPCAQGGPGERRREAEPENTAQPAPPGRCRDCSGRFHHLAAPHTPLNAHRIIAAIVLIASSLPSHPSCASCRVPCPRLGVGKAPRDRPAGSRPSSTRGSLDCRRSGRTPPEGGSNL